MTGYYEESLERDLARIRAKIAEMGELAERAVADAVRALIERNRQLAYSVILRDDRIDELEKEIDRLCLEFIVRQQPVGRHLRFAFATIKVNSELERVGDYSESIARHTLAVCAQPCDVPAEPLEEMAALAIPMLRDAIRAFTSEDGQGVSTMKAQEDRVDALRESFSTQLIRWREDGRIPLQAFGPLLNVGNRIERVADQARSIAQNASYVFTGDYPKHRGSAIYRVLFVDDANKSRSAMAEAIGNAMAQPRFVFASAGLEPAAGIDGATAFFLEQKGIPRASHPPQRPEKVPNFDHFQVLVALSEQARQIFPPAPSRTICLEWILPDPTRVGGSAEEIEAALEASYTFLRDHIRDLVEAMLGSGEPSSD
jgi:phosphate transport system protein